MNKGLLALFLVCLSISSLTVFQVASALSATNRNTVVTPGSATQPCSYDVFVDGSNFDALNCATGNIDYINADVTILIQTLNDNCPANGCLLFIENGNYPLSIQITTNLVTYQNAGFALKAGMELICESPKGTTFTGPTIPGPAANGYWEAITNKNRSTGDDHIVIENCGFNLTAPTQNANSLQAWETAIAMAGCNNCLIFNNFITNGGIEFRPNSVTINTATALTAGNNFGNIVQANNILNEPGSSTLFQSTNSSFNDNVINKCWDDCFLIGSAGINNAIFSNLISGAPVVSGKGALTGAIYVQNDGAVCGPYTGNCMAGNVIQGNLVQNVTGQFTGGRHGIAVIGAAPDTIISQNVIRGNFGDGVHIEDTFRVEVTNNQISRNGQFGIYIIASTAGTFYDFQVLGNQVYNNGVGGGSVVGIRVNSNAASQNIQDVTIDDNIIWDDQASHTQTFGIGLASTGSLANLIIQGNNLARSPTATSVSGAGTFSAILLMNNIGYNPVNKITNFVYGTSFAPWGTSATIVASTDYLANGNGFYLTSSGGTSVTITIKDGAGNTIYAPGATLAVPFYVPFGDKVNWGACSPCNMAVTVTFT